MKLKSLLMASVAAAVCSISMNANAAPLTFDFSGPSGTALFQLDSSPTPDFSQTFIGSDQFSFSNVMGTFGGIAGTASTISFGDGIFSSLSITAPNLGFTQFNAPTLFTGSPQMPFFTTGSFTLVNPFFGNGTLTISDASTVSGGTPVPEPATWALMLFGLGAVAFASRYRRSKVTTRLQLAG